MLNLHVSNIKFNILGTPLLEKFEEFTKCSSSTLEIKHNYKKKFSKFYETSKRPQPYYSRLFPVVRDQKLLYCKPFEYRILTYSFNACECNSRYTN